MATMDDKADNAISPELGADQSNSINQNDINNILTSGTSFPLTCDFLEPRDEYTKKNQLVQRPMSAFPLGKNSQLNFNV